MERVRKARVLTIGEIGELWAALAEPVRTMFILGLGLGLRIGELLPLRIEDLDLGAGWLYVRRDYYRGHVQTPKTARSERRFRLPGLLVNMLREYLEIRKGQSDLLFPNSAGTFFDDRNLMRREVEPVCDRLKLPRFSWHSLRHYPESKTMPIEGTLRHPVLIRTHLETPIQLGLFH
jgi:integrase